MIPDCTLTTACFDLTKYNKFSRDKNTTLNNIKSLLEVPCYLVIYTDIYFYSYIFELRKKYNSMTHYIITDLESLNTFKYLKKIKENRIKYHPTKDERTCAETHLLCSSKFDLVLNTIDTNPFNTTKFGWIDSNVGLNFSKICVNYKHNMLLKLLKQCNENKFYLQILNACDPKLLLDLQSYYSQYRWVVCGCLFIAPKEMGIKILTKLNDIFIKHTMEGYGHGEEMYYLELLYSHKEDLHVSYGDYKHILNNFIRPTECIEYIDYVVTRFLDNKQYNECIQCCETVIKEYDNFEIEINYVLYFKLLFNYYISCFYVNKDKCKEIIVKIYQLIDINDSVNEYYNRNKDFYDSQFKFN